MIIYGAGMAGLLAGHMLRRHEPVICEAKKSLPNNHHAVLRFRSRAVAEATHIPFREVVVHKAIWDNGMMYGQPTLATQNMYAQKVAGIVRNRSIIDLQPSKRYIAPPDFIAQLARGLEIHYDEPLLISHIKEGVDEPAISTIPMKMLMRMVHWEHDPRTTFKHSPIWTLNVDLAGNIDVYQTIYYPNTAQQWYRASITGSRLTIEFIDAPQENMGWQYADFVLTHFGIKPEGFVGHPQWGKQEYGKLIPMDDELRHTFIDYMTDRFNIYSLGRFGTWRQILLDDVVNDIRVIDRLITLKSRYLRSLARQAKEIGHDDERPTS